MITNILCCCGNEGVSDLKDEAYWKNIANFENEYDGII